MNLKESFLQQRTLQTQITGNSDHSEYLFYNSETQKLDYSGGVNGKRIPLRSYDITYNKTGG